MKYKITSKCGRIKEITADSKKELNEKIVDDFGFKIKEIKFDTSIYWQRHSRYKNWVLGKSKTSMQQYGCALMCFSYLAKQDPKKVDELFMQKGVYNNDLIDFEKAAWVLKLGKYERNSDINRMPIEEYTIKEVTLGKGQHFVVRINQKGERTIFDPWLGAVLKINHYKFRSYRIFKK